MQASDMLSIRYSPTFIRMYKRLEENLKEETREKIVLFQHISNHEKLKVRKLKGILENTYSFSVNYKIRVLFEYESKQLVSLLYVGSHDEVYS